MSVSNTGRVKAAQTKPDQPARPSGRIAKPAASPNAGNKISSARTWDQIFGDIEISATHMHQQFPAKTTISLRAVHIDLSQPPVDAGTRSPPARARERSNADLAVGVLTAVC